MAGALGLAVLPAPGAAAGPTLVRNPYLTDVSATTAIVNFATDTNPSATGSSAPTVTYGKDTGSGTPAGCTGSSTTAAGTRIGLGSGISEYQFKAHLVGLAQKQKYCYSIDQNGTTLATLVGFTAAPQPANPAAFTFAVIGDWGAGTPDEHNVLSVISQRNPAFLVTVGDNAYPSGTQADYGDTVPAHTGGKVFPSLYYPQIGGGTSAFMAQGNHGFTAYPEYLTNWPQDSTVAACQSAGCRYQPDPYPSYKGSTATNYASAWYAFNWGNSRFYMLEAAWSDRNIGTASSPYEVDFNQHWTTSSAEYQWLKSDLAAHTSTAHKFAFFHYPLHADTTTQGSDTFLNTTAGADSLENLLGNNGVNIAFAGHSHIYERTGPTVQRQCVGTETPPCFQPMVTYVQGTGGDALGSLSTCSPEDAYGLGGTGSHCGGAPAPTSDQQVHSFLLVNVDEIANSITVTPTDENGNPFDEQIYTPPPPPPTGTIGGPAGGSTQVKWTLGGPVGLLGATITCSCGRTVISGSDGSYTIDKVPPGTYTLTPSYPSESTFTSPSPASGSVTVPPAGGAVGGPTFVFSTPLTTISKPVGDMNGGVSGPDFATPPVTGPLDGITLDCSCGVTIPTGPTPGVPGAAKGSWALNGAPPHTYTIDVHAPGYVSDSASVTVAANGTVTKSFTLVPGGSIAGQVIDAVTNLPVDGATVGCTCGGVTYYQQQGAGTYAISDLVPGASGTLTATAAGYIAATAAVTVPAHGTLAQSIALQPSPGAILGTVTDFKNKLPISSAQISCTCTPGVTAVTASDGTYEINNLAPGTYDLSASAPLHDPVTVTGLVLGPGGTIQQDFALPQAKFVPPPTPPPGSAGNPIGGYWLVASDGGIFPFGLAGGFGSTGNIHLNKPIVGMAATADGGGYWLVASDGGIFPFGNAVLHSYGSMGGTHLNQPIVGMAAAPDGNGYWLVAADGGIFPFGPSAIGRGSTGGQHLNKPIVGMAVTPKGNGYWLVAADGGIFPFGTAGGFGSTGGIHLNQPVVGMSATPDGKGYWLVASDGGIFPFGPAAAGYGSTGGMHLNQPMVGMAVTPDGKGYWLVARDGGMFPFGLAGGYGGTGGIHLNQPIVGMTALPKGGGGVH